MFFNAAQLDTDHVLVRARGTSMPSSCWNDLAVSGSVGAMTVSGQTRRDLAGDVRADRAATRSAGASSTAR